ncbi:deoxyuridine 5'-triphosphate nucleotidohydrolase [candidate division TA06 bacterium DG_24]|uniref:Deoxyuridine 5'-triphosphate nucleotidohydrolase n=2 Tax=Bacteria division TA06 TaxID=1156500 RepID=A0A0S8JJ24_UNCT6|nr:MAG: deoxyuridine 5'-triphosphate nucleotidohydrolase [candidate division TA06 bacterium DG_24]KPL09672.1 MAG: deoxyuridine 5'-triphosphate nucleotidohydrolase [candidate division TA06 bacterium SM1_40]
MAEILTREELWGYLNADPPLVQGMVDPDLQVQVDGIELTVRQVARFADAGRIGVSEDERRISRTAVLEFDEEGWIHLPQGCYKALFNEIIAVPRDVVAIARPRSTLLRNGMTVHTALWDSGYVGRSESLLVVYNPYGCRVRKDARLIQLVFFKLSRPVRVGYSGRYSGENIDE